MLLGRAIQGAGGAIYPLAFGIVRDQFPRERIAGAIGLVSSLVGIGAGLGLIVPGFILQDLSYHWLFWLPLAVLAATTPLTILCVPRSPVQSSASINWSSAALMAIGLAGLLVAVSEATALGLGLADDARRVRRRGGGGRGLGARTSSGRASRSSTCG